MFQVHAVTQCNTNNLHCTMLSKLKFVPTLALAFRQKPVANILSWFVEFPPIGFCLLPNALT